MTKVLEWTNEETGVGAAIAAGNHLLNGVWALLVKDIIKIIIIIIVLILKWKKKKRLIINHISPSRLVIIVNKDPDILFQLL